MKSFRILLKDGRALTVKAEKFLYNGNVSANIRFFTSEAGEQPDGDFHVPASEVSVVVPVEFLVEESASASREAI